MCYVKKFVLFERSEFTNFSNTQVFQGFCKNRPRLLVTFGQCKSNKYSYAESSLFDVKATLKLYYYMNCNSNIYSNYRYLSEYSMFL